MTNYLVALTKYPQIYSIYWDCSWNKQKNGELVHGRGPHRRLFTQMKDTLRQKRVRATRLRTHPCIKIRNQRLIKTSEIKTIGGKFHQAHLLSFWLGRYRYRCLKMARSRHLAHCRAERIRKWIRKLALSCGAILPLSVISSPMFYGIQ